MKKAENISNDDELDKAIAEMHQIATQYLESHPDSEGGYVVKASIYSFCNDMKNARDVLQKAVDNINRAPKCNLKLADIAFDKGEYDQARAYLEKAKQFAIGKDSSISQSYVYYLDFICLANILHEPSVSLDDMKAKELKSLYEQTEIVLNQNEADSSWLETVEQQYQMLIAKLGLADE
jgi:tetratricopeptide (TPR) repeat protein